MGGSPEISGKTGKHARPRRPWPGARSTRRWLFPVPANPRAASGAAFPMALNVACIGVWSVLVVPALPLVLVAAPFVVSGNPNGVGRRRRRLRGFDNRRRRRRRRLDNHLFLRGRRSDVCLLRWRRSDILRLRRSDILRRRWGRLHGNRRRRRRWPGLHVAAGHRKHREHPRRGKRSELMHRRIVVRMAAIVRFCVKRTGAAA
jgi:hypothetical protein